MRTSSTSSARRGRWIPLCSLLATLGILLAAGATAGADPQVSAPGLVVRSVDARSNLLSVEIVATAPGAKSALSLKVDGDRVTPKVQSFAEAGRTSQVVVVLDNSSSMSNGALETAKQELKKFKPGQSNISQLGVVTFGGRAQVVAGLTSSLASVERAVKDVHPGGNPTLIDGILAGLREFNDDPSVNHQLVVISSAKDGGSVNRVPDIEKFLRSTNVTAHLVALSGGSPDMDMFGHIRDIAGGTLSSVGSVDFPSVFETIAEQVGSQYLVTAAAPSRTEEADLVPLDITWGAQSFSVAYEPGSLTAGAQALLPDVAELSLLSRLMKSTIIEILVVVLGTASVGMIVYSAAMLVVRDTDRLDRTLRHYDGYVTDAVGDLDEGSSLGRSQFLKRAVEVTGDLAERQGALAKIEELLERADLPLRPAEALFFYAAGAVVAGIGALVLSGNFLVLVMVVLMALVAPRFIVGFRAKRRNKAFIAQLPDMLQLLSGTLRAGYSVSQGIEAVSVEIEDPMGRELRRVMAEARLGRPLENALEAAAVRTNSPDFSWAVMAIRIQREVGGNLAELLMTVSETMVQRERLRRDVAGLTAEGRMSAGVLGALPPGIAGVMWVMNPEYIGKLTESSLGYILLALAGVSMGIGFMWMKKIINIEI